MHGRPVPGTLVEIWQANAAGRYLHEVGQHPAPLDPIFNSVPEAARGRLISRVDLGSTEPEWALAYEWDIVLRGHGATLFETGDEE